MSATSISTQLSCQVKRLERGFTLIELMVTLVVLAIMLSIAVPSFSRMIAEQRVRTVAADIQNALLLTRSAAVTRNAQVALAPNSGGWEAGWTIHTVAVGDEAEVTLAESPAVSSITVTASSGGDITFRANGRASGAISFSVVSESDESVGRCISLDASGRPVASAGACS